jgi:hypothetical protein
LATTASKFARGAIIQDTGTGFVYRNNGTVAAPVWQPLNMPVVRSATATADGTGLGTLAAGSQFTTVSASDANHWVTLPAPVVGTEVILRNGATGYEIRTSDPATIAINGGAGAGAESAIAANTLVRLICDTATTWIGTSFATAGTVTATQVAAA